MTLTSSFALKVDASLSTQLDLAASTSALSKAYRTALTSGVLAGQADRLFHDRRTIAASGTDDLDLAGVLVDALGATATFARVKGLIVAADAANTNNVVVGGATSNGFITPFGAATHTVTVRPGATLALFAGPADLTAYLVTAATGDLLRIANSGAGSTVTYEVIVIGASS